MTRVITETPAEEVMNSMAAGGGEEMSSATAVSAVEGSTAASAVNPGEGEGGGAAALIVPPPAGGMQYSVVRFGYANNGQAVTFALGCQTNGTWAREFRYDGARARYLDRKLRADLFAQEIVVADDEVWTDYDGDDAYGDFRVTAGNPSTVSEVNSYEPGLWRRVNFMSRYQHGDHLGTLRLTSTPGGNGSGITRTFTAFGEPITPTTDRFGYVGAWGYESHSEMPYLHVGARYYDPSSGRFLQRDPIGIEGGLNVYSYADNNPTDETDEDGLTKGGKQGKIPSDLPPGFENLPKDKQIKVLEKIAEAAKSAKHKAAIEAYKKIIKKGAKKVAKSIGGKIFPVLGVGFFAYDWYQGGFRHALSEATCGLVSEDE